MLDKGEMKPDARKKLEEMEAEFKSGKVNAMPPKEFRQFVEECEELLSVATPSHQSASVF